MSSGHFLSGSSVASGVGVRVRVRREERNLLQRDLALRAGLPIRTLGRIERGEVDVRLSTLAKIAAALGVSLKELMP